MYIRIQQASTASDREEVFRFRYRIQVEELGQEPDDADHDSGTSRDPLDDRARILVAVDESTGAILGTLRAVFGSDGPFPPGLVDDLDIHSMLVAFGDDRLSHTGAFLVDPAYRGQTVASQLAGQMVRWMLAEGIEVDTCRVALSQARSWFQMGYRPYGPLAHAAGSPELIIPLALVLRDRRYLERVASPLVRLLGPSELGTEAVAQRLQELYPHFEDQLVTPQRLGEFWASVAHATTSARPASLFDQMDRQRLEPLLRSLTTLRVRADGVLPEGGAHEQGLGLILEGRLGLTMEEGERPFFVNVLQSGDVFGSLGGIVTTPPSARLVAIEDAKVLVLDDELLSRLEPSLTTQLRHNLSAILSQRLDATTRQVAGFMRGSPERIPLAPEIGAEDEEPAAVPESSEEPWQENEATHPLDLLELGILGRLDLDDPGALLEIEAGVGDTSLLMARAFPNARIVGVESDPSLCTQAEALAVEQGLDDHCTFLAGNPAHVPLEPDTVDGAYLRMVLQKQAHPEEVLRELARVVRPGGLVVAWELDDGGVLAHPEPEGLAELLEAVKRAQAIAGGDRHVGRKLADLMRRGGLEEPYSEVMALGPPKLPLDCTVELLHDSWLDALEAAGGPTERDWRGLNALLALPAKPGAWLTVPAVLAWARVPRALPWV